MIQFWEPYLAQDAQTHFPLYVVGYNEITGDFLCVNEEGMFILVPIGRVQTNIRWDFKKNAFLTLTEPQQD